MEAPVLSGFPKSLEVLMAFEAWSMYRVSKRAADISIGPLVSCG
jgi:hypothetical protein